METQTKTKIALTLAALALSLAVLPFVAADSFELWCLADGEVLDLPTLCNPNMNIQTGPFNVCMHILDNGKKCPALLNTCNNLGLACNGTSSGGGTIDVEPPIIELFSPTDGAVYTSRAVLVDFDLNERADFHFQYNDDPGRWTQICNDCFSSSRSRTFEEGENDVTFRATDRAGNEAFQSVIFRIDSRDPRIQSTEPSAGFGNGFFLAEFEEDNPNELKLHYGNSQTGFREKLVDIAQDCTQDDSEYQCTTFADLQEFDGQQINYHFSLTDIAGNLDESNPETLSVDDSDPILSSVDFSVSGDKVTFTLDIDEPFFEEAVYIDSMDSDLEEERLCTSLEGTICEKEIRLREDGERDIEIIIRDQAGNEFSQTIQDIFTDSEKPKITEVSPDRGFTNGELIVQFEEANPTDLELTYGNTLTGFENLNIDLGSCSRSGEEHTCFVDVLLDNYDGQEIDSLFTLTDRAGQIDQDGSNGLAVDISPPEIDSLNFDVNGKSVTFTLEVDEAYLDEIIYIDNLDDRPRERRLCSRLRDGVCTKKVSFKDGDHDVTITVYDQAGFAVAQNVQFFTDSKKPRIKSLSPDRDFAPGWFEVELTEMNPTSLVIDYGNSQTGFRSHQFDLNACTPDRDDLLCKEFLDLSAYDSQELEYSVLLTDRVGQTDQDGEDDLLVDISPPVINSLDFVLDDDEAIITLDITEQNFEEISYINNNDNRPRERRLCSRLDDSGVCEDDIRLNQGNNAVDITVLDEAGNIAEATLNIFL